MNRLILIGNGFDLAHGLKTSYKNFIDDFWFKEYYRVAQHIGSSYNGTYLKISNIPTFNRLTGREGNYEKLKGYIKDTDSHFTFENKLLGIISDIIIAQNWADLESVFYGHLIKFLPSEKLNVNVRKVHFSIENLNKEFDEVKSLLIQYLSDISAKIEKVLAFTEIDNHIYGGFRLKDFCEDIQQKKIKHFCEKFNELNAAKKSGPNTYFQASDEEKRIIETMQFKHDENDTIKLLFSEDAFCCKYFDLMPHEIMLLNFNYTNTPEKYTTGQFGHDRAEINYIHGSLENMDINPIIFGFGDELDEKYPQLEALNDNKYLENIKSIAYLRTSNYKKMLSFVESDIFQVYIMGHSCGLSDRTLLNTIFEHKNCKSIKPFYHVREDGTNNYSDIVRNISRSFKDKAKMRDVVVNQTYCEPLTSPQLSSSL